MKVGTDGDSNLQRLFASAIGSDISFLLAHTSAIASQHGNRALRALGLNVRLYTILSLAVADLRPTQKEFSEFLQLAPSQIVALIDTLEGRGLVKRQPGSDRRSKELVATERGRELYAKAENATRQAELEALAHIPERERMTLRAILRRPGSPNVNSF